MAARVLVLVMVVMHMLMGMFFCQMLVLMTIVSMSHFLMLMLVLMLILIMTAHSVSPPYSIFTKILSHFGDIFILSKKAVRLVKLLFHGVFQRIPCCALRAFCRRNLIASSVLRFRPVLAFALRP